MLSGSDWYQDEARLLVELQRDGGKRSRLLNIDGYDDIRELGRGGQGVVYSATQRSTRRRVAIKVLLDGAFASQTARRRFEREIEMVAALRHPNVVQIYDSGVTADERLYYVMEYIEGVPLDELIPAFVFGDSELTEPRAIARTGVRSGATGVTAIDRVRIRGALELFVRICDAVNAAHLRGIIHRDLKPSNIRVDPAGEPHVLDFGLAKAQADPASSSAEGNGRRRDVMTASGEFMGSLPWASPEQAEARHATMDVRTDVYSLGVILFQLLTGNFPYDVTGRIDEALRNIAKTDPVRPRTLRPAIGDEVETIVLKCLAKEPERRYQSAGELARDVRCYLAGEPIDARRDSAWYVLRKNLRRFKAAVAVSAAFLIVSIVFSITMLFLYQRATSAEAQAKQQFNEAAQARDAERIARTAAEQEADKARQTYSVLAGMLKSANPRESRGHDVTVRELLDRTAATVATDFAGQPELEASVRHVLGDTYLALDLLAQAGPQLERAVELRKQHLGSEHRDTLASQDDLAHYLVATGKVREGLDLLTAVYEIQARVLGPDDPDTLEALNNRGVAMGYVAPAQSVEILQAALEGRTRALGADHTDTLVTMSSLAVLLKRVGRLEEAEVFYRRGYEAQLALHGADHPYTLTARGNLAAFLHTRGRTAEAIAMEREVLEARRRVFGAEHSETLTAMSNLGMALSESGDTAAAEALYREALGISERVLGGEAAQTMILTNNLAHLLQHSGRPDEAAPLFERVLEVRRRTRGAENSDTLLSASNLAVLYEEQGRVAEAEQLLRDTLEIQRRVLGPTHLDALITLNNLAKLLSKRGDHADAEPLQREAADGAERTLTAEHWITASFRGNLGATLTKLGRHAEAESVLKSSIDVLRRTLGDADARTQGVVQRLIELFESTGRGAEADALRAKLGR